MSHLNQDIVDKVRKLLALATSPNEHEAQAAAAKAHELLSRHNLTLGAVEESRIQEEYGAVDSAETASQAMENRYIFSLLQNFFYVKIIVQRKAIKTETPAGHSAYRNRHHFTIIGRNHNVEIARYVYGFLSGAFRRGFKQYWVQVPGWKPARPTASFKRGYYRGVYGGLHNQLQASQQKVLAATQQVAVVKDPGIDQFIQQQYGEVGETRKTRHVEMDQRALQAGYQDGRNMKIMAGLTSEAAPKAVGQQLRIAHGRKGN